MKSQYQVHMEQDRRRERIRFWIRAILSALILFVLAFLAITFVIVLWGRG